MIKAQSENTVMVRLEDGERLPDVLLKMTVGGTAILAGVGMLRDVVLGYWDGERYVEEPLDEPVELLSFQGNIGDLDDRLVVHAHVVVGRRDLTALGGHLLRATAHNTVELVLLNLPGVRLVRKPEPSGLPGLYPSEEG
ncbi:MAG: DUF296 domain-containing protein [Candidatus Bipolaricaulota bacterium]